jgi:uncharacterized membrane protein YgcG
MNTDLAVILGVVAAGALLAIAILAFLSRPRLPDLAHVPSGSAPPANLSPALAGMIDAGTYPKPAMTAAVTSLERQGFLSISQPVKDGPYRLTRLRRDDPPHHDEAALLRELFPRASTIDVDASDPANRKILAAARKQHEAAVRRVYGTAYYRAFMAPMFLSLVLAAAAAFLVMRLTPGANYGIGAAVFFAAMVGTSQAFGGSGQPPRRRHPAVMVLLMALLVALPVALVLALISPPAPYVLVAAIGAGHGLTGAWLPRFTQDGLQARQDVQGLRAYVQHTKPEPAEIAAGRDAADARYRHLRPYAMAMGAGPAWNARHLALLGALGVAVWAATQPHGAGSDRSDWSSDSGAGADTLPDDLPDDLGGAFDSAFESAFADAFDSAVSDSSDSGSSDSGGGDSGGGGDGGGGE